MEGAEDEQLDEQEQELVDGGLHRVNMADYKQLLQEKKEQHLKELTTWTNDILREHDISPIDDLRKRISDGSTLVQLLEILGHEKIQGIHSSPTNKSQKAENLRQCVSYLDLKGGDTHGINQKELADGNLKSTLMFMNSVRKRYDPHFAPREMADGASQPGQISSRPGSAHARYPPEPDPPPLPPGPKPGYRPHSGPPVVMRRDLLNGSGSDILPGTLGRQEEEGRAPLPPANIVSTTELDRNSASQRGVEERRSYLPPGSASSSRQEGAPPPLRPRSAKPAPTSTPPPPPSQASQAWTSSSSSGNTPKLPPKQLTSQEVREAVSLTVEERLKTLLGSPGGGGGSSGGIQKLQPGGQGEVYNHRPPPPPHPHQKGHVNGGYQYDDGELLLPPPRNSTEYHGRRGSIEGYPKADGHQAHPSNEGEFSYVPSRPSDRMPGVSRGLALHNNKPNQPGSGAGNRGPSPGPPLPPKSVGQPPRYQPPPQYSPYLRRSSGGAPAPPPPSSTNGPNMPQPSNALRNVCNKLYTRDSSQPYNNPSQQGPPSPYGPGSQSWQKYGGNPPPASNHSQNQPRTSPMGQSSSGTASMTSGQGSNSHSPSSPSSKPPAGPYQSAHPGHAEYGAKPYNPQERRLSGTGPPSLDMQSRTQLQDNRLSGSSTGTDHKSPYERPPSSNQRTTNGPSATDPYGSTISAQDPRIHNPASRNNQTSYSHTIAMKDHTGKYESGSSVKDGLGSRSAPPPLAPRTDNIELKALSNGNKRNSGELGVKLGSSGVMTGGDSASAMAHQASQMALKPNPKWRDSLASDDGNFSPSISSSRSVTPPLPPLSPDNTPPHTPPDSPSLSRHGGQHHLRSVTNAPGFLARTPDVVTSTAKKVTSVPVGKKKAGRKAGGAPLSVKTWDGRSKRTYSGGGGGKRITLGKPPRPPTNVMNGHHGSGDEDSVGQDTATNTSFTEADYATVNGTGTGPLEAHEARIIRQQLEGLETMYHEILKLLGLDREYIPGSRRSISSTSSISRSGRPRMKRSHSAQHRSRDLKQVNKRFARLESHVVTLARSVAHLSSEMRNHNGLYTDVEEIKREMGRLKELVQSRNHPNNPLSDWERFRGWVPSLTNPKRVNKLTKFFGQEPPLLHIFLKKLGYEKYVTNFEQEKIGMIELPYMNEDRLQRIGIPMGPRLRILQEAQLCFRQENFDIYIV